MGLGRKKRRVEQPGKRDFRREPEGVTFFNLLLALIGCLFLFCGSVVLVLNLRSIYYFDISYLNLTEETGMSGAQIRENYDVLIDYNLFTKGVHKLEFPDFPMSEQGETHFREVKRIFLAIQYLTILSGILFLLGLVRQLPRRDYGSLKLLSVFSLLIPTALGIAVALNWERFFIGFHELVFSNDYWIFDPATDPVILILPDEFFFHCAAAILVFILLGAMVSGAVCRFLEKRDKT